jgi:hypothetical protein
MGLLIYGCMGNESQGKKFTCGSCTRRALIDLAKLSTPLKSNHLSFRPQIIDTGFFHIVGERISLVAFTDSCSINLVH